MPAPLGLLEESLRGVDPNSHEITAKHGETKISDYMFVKFLPNIKFNKLESAIPYLKDKTISICRSKVIAQYLSNNAEKGHKNSWKDTRLLLFFLLNPTALLDHVNYLDQYTYSDSLEELMDYLVLRIVSTQRKRTQSELSWIWL